MRKVLVIGIFALALGVRAAPSDAADNIVPVKEENGQKLVVTHMAGTEYHIPINYLESYKLRDQEKELSLSAMLPNMREIIPHELELKNFDQKRWDRRKDVRILVDDARSTTSFEYRLDVTKGKMYGPLHSIGQKFDLHAYLTSKGSFGRLIADSTPVFSGSKIIEHPTPEQRKGLLEEFYVDTDSGAPSVYITCSGDSAVPSPSCTEIFDDNGLLYHIDYSKYYLSEWKAIKTSAIKLMHGFARHGSDKK